MKNEIIILENKQIQNKIYTIRSVQVMIDRDLATMYKVNTSILNQAAKRNINRFPESFRFQLTKKEFENWKSQIVISNKEIMGLRKMPYAFTEQGVAMLSAVLKSKVAIKISVQIMNAFVNMRRFIYSNASIFARIDSVERKQIEYTIESNNKFNKIFNALERKNIKPKQGVFFNGQIFDAYKFVSDIFRSAKNTIIILDNYIDDSVLTILTKKKKNVNVIII